MKFNKFASIAALAVAATISMSTIASAATYKDVTSSHWAYSAVNEVSNLGIITGDLSGNFNPDASIDKFETVKMFAKMAGYKYTNVSAEEQAYYDRCYANRKTYISQYSSKFSKWNSTADKEIAFLLEQEILMPDDLNQFIVIVDGQEKFRALSREEVAIFLVRFLDKSSEALNTAYSASFKDDSSITMSAKPYIYYLKSKGVVGGDTNNNYSPKNAVTKAAMAVLVQKTLSLSDASMYINPGTNNNTNANTNANTYQNVSGTITTVYSSFRAVQMSSNDANFNAKIYPVSATASITVNGYAKTFADLEKDMTFTGMIYNSELISITAVKSAAAPAAPPVTSDYNNATVLDGTVASVKFDTTGNYVGIEVRMINPKGEIISEVKTYTIASNCTVTRGGKATTYHVVTKGDLIKAEVSGNTAYKIELEEKNRSLTATLQEKKITNASNYPTLVVKDKDNNVLNFTLDNNSYVYRKGNGEIGAKELRIGDSLDITAEYGKIKEIYAYGSKSNLDAYVKSVYISDTLQSRITVSGTINGVDEETYTVINGATDMYSLRVGSKVRLRLDSNEVESLIILQDATSDYITGYITSYTKDSVTVKDISNSYNYHTYAIDSSTIIMDSTTGLTATYNNFGIGAKVYISATSSSSSRAKSITILAY